LPWTARGANILDRRSGYVIWFDQDMKVDARIKADRDYIVHAANAYPKLVAALQRVLRIAHADNCTDVVALDLLKELGEEVPE
jgi:hypothetical protein